MNVGWRFLNAIAFTVTIYQKSEKICLPSTRCVEIEHSEVCIQWVHVTRHAWGYLYMFSVGKLSICSHNK